MAGWRGSRLGGNWLQRRAPALPCGAGGLTANSRLRRRSDDHDRTRGRSNAGGGSTQRTKTCPQGPRRAASTQGTKTCPQGLRRVAWPRLDRQGVWTQWRARPAAGRQWAEPGAAAAQCAAALQARPDRLEQQQQAPVQRARRYRGRGRVHSDCRPGWLRRQRAALTATRP